MDNQPSPNGAGDQKGAGETRPPSAQHALLKLPHYLRAQCLRCPTTGNGVHQWLFVTALKLHAHLPPKEIFAILSRAVGKCGRPVPEREIRSAINDSAKIAKGGRALDSGDTLNHRTSGSRPKPWPGVNPVMRKRILEDARDLDRLELQFQIPTDGPPYGFVRMLMPSGCLICCGESHSSFETRKIEDWKDDIDGCQFIVPSPMSAIWGDKKDGGGRSMHTLDNTGARRFIVVEFDNAAYKEQRAFHLNLSERAPLVLAVHSGGKSIHGWYLCEGMPEERVRAFFEYAVRLGADTRTWTRSQFVRLPNGIRVNADGSRLVQRVIRFNPMALRRRNPFTS